MLKRALSIAVLCGVAAWGKSLPSQEIIPGNEFQDRVIRFERNQQKCDSLPEGTEHDFACAAAAYYSDKFAASLEIYRKLLGTDSTLDRSILSRIARSQFEEKHFDEARKTLADGDARFAGSSEWAEFSDRIRLDLALEDPAIGPKAKADSIDRFLKNYSDDSRGPRLRYQKGVLLEKAKRYKDAKKAYLYVIAHPSEFGEAAWKSLRDIRAKAPTETLDEKIVYAGKLCEKGFHEECVALTDSIFALAGKDTIPSKSKISLIEKRAGAYRQLKKDSLAILSYRFLIDSVEARATWLQSLVRLYRANKMAREAALIDSLFQDKFRFTTQNANNLWVRAFEYEQKKLFDKAIASYDSLNDPHFKQSDKRKWVLFRIALCYLKQDKIDSAVIAFTKAKDEGFLWSSSGARMFLADIFFAQGKLDSAKTAYLDCIKDFPVGYYAHRSRIKLVEHGLLDSASVPWLAPRDLSDSLTLAWIRSVQGGKSDPTHTQERYETVKRLLDLGFAEEAFDLYRFAYKKNKSRLEFLYAYAELFLSHGELIQGYALARRFQNEIPRKYLADAPRGVMKVLYPKPFEAQVLAAADSSIDPQFVYSVMRQESTFNYLITSPANACGLLQIIPPTAKKLAKAEGVENFSQKLLYNPYMNIRLGVRYLKDLLTEYENDPMYVLANYNAGPKPAKRWQAAGKELPWDLRAEEISYWETRDYVKRVLGNYWVYSEVWER